MPCPHRFPVALVLVANGLLATLPACGTEPAGSAATLAEPATTVITADEALDHVGKECTVEFVVAAARKLDDKEVCFLNSTLDHRQKDNFTAVIFRTGLARFTADGVADPGATFLDARIRVHGLVTEREGRAQIVVESPEQIRIVRADEPAGSRQPPAR
jgi:hypothetical protein